MSNVRFLTVVLGGVAAMLSMLIPGVALAAATTFPTITITELLSIIENIGNWIFVVGLIIVVIMFIIGAFMFIEPFSGGGGNPARVESARKIFFWAIIGLVIILSARGIFAVVRSIIGA